MTGSYESLNPFNLKFAAAPQLLIGNVFQSLMARSQDEPYAFYALIAQSIEIDPKREHVVFHLDPRARFSDGSPVTAEDVLFSFDLLKAKGRPGQREAFARVVKAESPDANTVRFEFASGSERELPLLFAAMPVLSKKATDVAHFDDVRMDVPIGSGPYVVKAAKGRRKAGLDQRP